MLEQRKQWIRKRFGNIDNTLLGKIEDTKDIIWPDLVTECEIRGNKLKFQMIKDIEKSAKRIAEIYRNGLDEIVGNSEYEWHLVPDEIIKKVRTGDWNFYGCYFNGILVLAESFHIIRGQRAIQLVWAVVDPIYRGKGTWQPWHEYLDSLIEMSGAQTGFCFVVTTHRYSQIALEKIGYRPMGFFIGGEFMGGSDGNYYRQNVIYYGKLFGEGKKHIQKFDTMELTEKAEKLANTVKELWECNEFS